MKNIHTMFILLPYNVTFPFMKSVDGMGSWMLYLKLNLAYEKSCANIFPQSSEIMNEYIV